MKKIFAVSLALLTAVLLAFSAAGCSGKTVRPSGISAAGSLEQPPETVQFEKTGVWPENSFTDQLPVPEGKVRWTVYDSKSELYGISLTGMTRKTFDQYFRELQKAGFRKIEKADAGEMLSVGSVVSDGSRTVSLSYSNAALMIAVSPHPTAGNDGGFFKTKNLTNVHVNTYAKYDAATGVLAAAEVYLPEKSKLRPQFTGMNGVVSMTLGGKTADFYIGALSENGGAFAAERITGLTGKSGEKGYVTVSGIVSAENAVAGGGAFTLSFEIKLP